MALEHVRSLIIKFIMMTVALFVVLSLFYGVSFINVLWTSLLLTIASYLLGDLLVLDLAGNWAATIADLGLAFLGIWLIGAYLYDPSVPAAGAAIISAIVIAVCEWFFHNYMNKQVLRDPETAES